LNSKDDTIPVGKITGLHGVKGEVKLTPYGDLEGVEWKTVYIAIGGSVLTVVVNRSRAHKGRFILELEGYSDRDSAATLTGAEVSIKKDDLPPLAEDEYYYDDLVGMEVVTDDGRELGLLKTIISTGSNDVFEVKGPLGEVLIPAIRQVVLDVDSGKKRITVHLLEGLLPEEGAKGKR
jgi:16S rRNA processing protein RimM